MVRSKALLLGLALLLLAPFAAADDLVSLSQPSAQEEWRAVQAGARIERRMTLPNGYRRTVLRTNNASLQTLGADRTEPVHIFKSQQLSGAAQMKRRFERNASTLSTQDVEWEDLALWGLNRVRGFGASLGRTASVATNSGQRKSRLCIVDSGIDKTHSRILQPNGQSIVTREFNFAWDTNLPSALVRPAPYDSSDDKLNPHGSHVAGIAAANDRFNGYALKGVANGAVEIYNAKVIGPHRQSGTVIYGAYDIDTALGILWCAGVDFSGDSDFLSYYGVAPAAVPRADVINLSLGGPNEDDGIAFAIQYAQDLGIVVVASAGNSYDPEAPIDENDGTMLYPAKFPGVIAVGATDIMDKVADFSARGSLDRPLDIVAPGVDIVSSLTVENGVEYYGLYSGTSMSAPFVAGTIALQLATTPWVWTASGTDLGLPLRDQGRLGLLQVPDSIRH